jgi:hypothetical protein
MKTDVNEVPYLVEYTEEKIHRWLVELTYWYGWKRGFTAYKEEGNKCQPQGMDFLLLGWEAQPWNLEFCWYISYGHYYLHRKDHEDNCLSNFIINGKALDTIVAINRNDLSELNTQDVEKLIKRLEKMLCEFFPGIRQINGLRICTLPAHQYNCLVTDANQYDIKPHISLCKLIDRTWVCETCIEQFGLDENKVDTSLPLKKYQNEMKRLTPERKLAVLQRDNFTCQRCGINVVNNQDIQLRVKHIVSVMDGGKTVLDNLTTVCLECEQGFTEEI